MYARYSSDLQRDSSIDDQIRRGREYAAPRQWPIVEEWVIADREVSAASIIGRNGLQKLINAAKSKDRPFDCILIDDTSRLARDLSDALRIVKTLEYHGVACVFVSQGIDTSLGNARPLLAMCGIVDEEYLTGLASKVHRGQEGRALSGFTTGGRVYGYDNVPVEDRSRTGKYGRPAVLGVNLEVNPEQATIVIRIFRMYAQGWGQGRIAVQLNREGITGPNGPWSRYTIHEMLRNERYRGVFVWGRTRKARNPETGLKVSRPTPASEWRRVDVSPWRIVPEELWMAVEERRNQACENFHSLGGMTRTERGRTYLFSGILLCGECGGSMVISAGGGKRGYVKYGCHTHKHTGCCRNKLMIRQDRLEGQLLAAIEQRLLTPTNINSVVKQSEDELRRRLSEMERHGAAPTMESMQKDLADCKRRQLRLAEALEIGGDILLLVEKLRKAKSDIERIEAAITAYRPIRVEKTVNDMRARVSKALLQLRETLLAGENGDVARAKEALAKHLKKLVLTPSVQDGRPVYKVTGRLSVPDSGNCRMQVVARDGYPLYATLLQIPFEDLYLDPPRRGRT
jgi:DNA invertase Pin-like site-specific DNA recombinase